MDGRGDKHRHGERTRDGKPGKGDRGFPERRAGRPYRNRDERRGNERRRADRGRRPMRARPGHDRGGRPAGRGRTSPQRDLPIEPALPESAESTDPQIAEPDAPTETGTNVEGPNAAVTTVVANPCGLGRDMTVADVRPVGEEPPRSAIFPWSRNCPSPWSSPTWISRCDVNYGPFRRTS